jgi:hypothetical protein
MKGLPIFNPIPLTSPFPLTRERGKLSTEGQVSLQSIVVSCVARPSKAAVHDRLSIIHHLSKRNRYSHQDLFLPKWYRARHLQKTAPTKAMTHGITACPYVIILPSLSKGREIEGKDE